MRKKNKEKKIKKKVYFSFLYLVEKKWEEKKYNNTEKTYSIVISYDKRINYIGKIVISPYKHY